MYYYLYKITNKIDEKIYIGCHQTKNLDDGYMGSGKYLRRAIKKHGIDNFEKDILEYFDNKDDMFAMETILVNEDFINRKDTYNLCIGGKGGFITEHQIMGLSAALKKRNDDPELNVKINTALQMGWRDWWESLSDEDKALHCSKRVPNSGFAGKNHTSETKTKMVDSHKGKHIGKKNSQYGTCWIYSIIKKKSIKIDKDDLPEYITAGWYKGRKIKF